MIFALAGNQNCGKTTLFNALTGANQRVGNFPGVTVEKKTGTILQTSHQVVDLPGIYAMRPFSQEEMLTRRFLLEETPDAIVNIVDAVNLERNLYLTLQLLTLEIPMVVALNMMDEVRKNGGSINVLKLEKKLGVRVVPISAAKKEGLESLAETLLRTAEEKVHPKTHFLDKDPVERCVRAVEAWVAAPETLSGRFCAERLVEGEPDFFCNVRGDKAQIGNLIRRMESETGLDANAALADMRYRYIETIIRDCVRKPKEQHLSFQIDRIVLGKFAAFPLFFGILALMFFLTFHLLGPLLSGWLARSVSGFSTLTNSLLVKWNVHPAVRSLVIDGAFAGVGSALSFLPVVLVLFFLLSLLEDSGYMARVAFLMDRPMGCLGLSGRSFIPLLLGFGCTVPAALAARTLPSRRDRRITVLLTPFMSCSAKIPIFTVFAAAFFPGKTLIVICALYGGGILMGILAAAVLNRAILPGETAAFVLELPNYRLPTLKNGILLMWEKAKDFITRAFTVIFLASVAIWFLQTFDIRLCVTQDSGKSILAFLGRRLAPLFAPLGFGCWQVVTALAAGFTAKEAVVSTFGVLLGVSPELLPSALTELFSPAAALSFLTFTLLYTPCAAAVTAIGREMGSARKALGVILAQCGIAWFAAFWVYRVAALLA